MVLLLSTLALRQGATVGWLVKGGRHLDAARPCVRVFSVQVLCPPKALPKNGATLGNTGKNGLPWG